MVKIPESIQNIVIDYVNKIKHQIPIDKVILFGSYAKGGYTMDSDIDIAIFSDYFKDMAGVDAFKFLFLQTLEYDIDMQPLAFTVEEYQKPMGIVEDIIDTGVEINHY